MAIVVDKANIGTRMPCTDNITLTLTTNQTVASGGFIVLFAKWFRVGSPLVSIDGGGLTWNIDVQGSAAGLTNVYGAIVSAQAPSGLASGTVLTATWTATAESVSLGAMSFTGVKTSSALDTTVGPVGVSVAASGWTTGNASIAAGSVLVGVSGEETGTVGSSTPVAPSVESWDVLDCSSNVRTMAYRIESSAGSYEVAGTYSGNCQSVALGAAYLAAADTAITNEAGLRTAHTPVTWRT